MNITFLIGNGFDVGLGLKSKFKDFFPVYKELSKNKSPEIKQLSDEIEKDYDNNYKHWSDFEKMIGEYTINFTPMTKMLLIKQIRDFEQEFIKYLEEEQGKLSFDDKENISRVMISGLTQYLSNKVLTKDSSERIRAVYNNHMAENFNYSFINFNYTSMLENCLDTIPQKLVCKHKYNGKDNDDKISQIIYVHGKKVMQPIIGVNDESQIKNKELAKDKEFLNWIVKPLMNQSLGHGNDAAATSLINASKIICVYGMSLGETDKKWWRCLLKWLYDNTERQLILFEYDDDYSSDTPYDWFMKRTEVFNKFINAIPGSNLNVNFDQLSPRIHLAVHKNIFSLNLRNADDKVEMEKKSKVITAFENIETDIQIKIKDA